MAQPESLAELLNGRRAAIDATLPAAGFVAGWLASGRSIWAGTALAVGSAAATSHGRCWSGCSACAWPR